MAENEPESSKQWTNIDDLVAETEKIEFEISGSSPEENIDDVLKKVDLFRKESSLKLYVIEEERRKSIFVDGSESFIGDEDDEDDDDAFEDSGETTESTNSEQNGDTPSGGKNIDTKDAEEQKKALKTLRDIKRALKDLKSFNIEENAAEVRGDCRLRSSSLTNRMQRPKSSYPILESTWFLDKDLSRTNNNKVKKPHLFDIDTLNRELANLLSMSDAPFDPSLLEEPEEITSPRPVPATPPSTPANTFQIHPLVPSELSNQKDVNQTQGVTDAIPPPKPPRVTPTPTKKVEMVEKLPETVAENSVDQVAADERNDDQINDDQVAAEEMNDDQINDDQATADYSAEDCKPEVKSVACSPPPKPPRLNSVKRLDRLKSQMGTFSKSMGNLAFSGDSQAKSPPVIDSCAARNTDVESPEVGKTFGEKIEQIFSKEKMEQIFSKEKMEEMFSKEKVEKIFSFSRFKKKSKKGKDVSISNPTDFRHRTGSAPEGETTDEQAPLVSSEADTPTSDKNVPFISDSQAPSTPDEQEASEDSDTNITSEVNPDNKADDQTTPTTEETDTTSDQHSAPISNLSDGQINSGFDDQEGTAPEAEEALDHNGAMADPEEKSVC